MNTDGQARQRVAALLAVALVGGCLSGPGGEPGDSDAQVDAGKADDTSAGTCSDWTEIRALGRIDDGRAGPVAGLVRSWQRPDVVWAHNSTSDRDDNRLFAIDRFGHDLRTYRLDDIDGGRWEDIATDGESLYIVDTDAPDGLVDVHRLLEPDPASKAVDGLVTFRLETPTPDDIEAIFVVADEGALYAISKDDNDAQLLRVDLPLVDGARFETVAVAAEVGGLQGSVVSADITPDGRHIAAKVMHEGVRVWERAPGQSVASALATESCTGPGAEGKDRAVALEHGGVGYLLASEDADGRAVMHAVRRRVDCPEFDEVQVSGELRADSALELSGVVASRTQPGVLWAHNDGGQGDERLALVAFDATGRHFGDFALTNAVNEDWEDIAIAPSLVVEGRDDLYVGDIGDNAVRRDSITLIRVPEPEVGESPEESAAEVGAHEELVLRYADGTPHNAESLAIDPLDLRVIVITKRNAEDDRTRVFMSDAPPRDDEETVLFQVATDSDTDALEHRLVAIDVSPLADAMLGHADGGPSVLWPRHAEESWAQALTWPGCEYDAPSSHIEAIAFDADGGYVMVPEGKNPEILQARP